MTESPEIGWGLSARYPVAWQHGRMTGSLEYNSAGALLNLIYKRLLL